MNAEDFKKWSKVLCIKEIGFSELEMGKTISNGGHGTVRIAIDKLLNKRYIVKRNSRDINIQEEIVCLGLLQNMPAVVHLEGFTIDDYQCPWMVIEWAENGNLREYLFNKFAKLTVSDKVSLASGIAVGLEEIHRYGILHRDLHSRNVLIYADGRPKITDFRLSGVFIMGAEAGDVAGVIPYAAPEVLQRQPHTSCADVYSFGVIMWEISAGRPPFPNPVSDKKLRDAILDGDREQPAPGVPNEYVSLYQQCWECVVNKRPNIVKIIHRLEKLETMKEDNVSTTKSDTTPSVKASPASSITQNSNIAHVDHISRFSAWKVDKEITPLLEQLKRWDPMEGKAPPIDLFLAALVGNLDIVTWHLNHNDNDNMITVHSQDVLLHTPLHFAVFCPKPFDILKLLLEQGADPMATNCVGETPTKLLLIAPHEPHMTFECLELLEMHGGQLEWEDLYDKTLEQFKTNCIYHLWQQLVGADNDGILIKEQHRSFPTIKDVNQYVCSKVLLLMKYELHIFQSHNDKPNKEEIIQHFSSAGLFSAIDDAQSLQLLVDCGADVHVISRQGQTALHLAATKASNIETMRILMRSGVNLQAKDEKGQTALHVAALENNLEGVRILVKEMEPAGINAVDESGRRALHVISMNGCNIEAMRLLLEHGADVNVKDINGWTALHLVAQSEDGNVEAMRLLLENGVDVNAKGIGEWTVLHLVARKGFNIEVMRLLIAYGADVNAKDVDGQTILHLIALEWWNLEVVQLLVENKADFYARYTDGRTLLHTFVRERCDIEAMRLLAHAVDVNVKDTDGRTPLHWAAEYGHVEALRLLIESGANVNEEDRSGETALCNIARCHGDNVEAMRLLVSHGANVNAQYWRGQTLLHYVTALWRTDIEALRLLVENGADVNAKDYDGETALGNVTRYQEDNIEAMQLLVKKGAEINTRDSDGCMPLHRAAEKGNIAMVRCLVDLGADISAKDKYGRTALHWAAKNSHVEVIQYLLGRGVDTSTKDNDGWTVLHLVAKNKCESVDMVRILVKQGDVDVNAKDKDGLTALHFIAHEQNVNMDVMRFLVTTCKADINMRDMYGRAALHYIAMKSTSVEAMRFLVEQGEADINVKDTSGRTALHWAVRNDNIELVRYLVKRGVEINAKDKDGWTALHLAARHHDDNVDMARTLVEQGGADVNAKDKNGGTALHWAVGNHHVKVVKYLIEQGADVNAKDSDERTALHQIARHNSNRIDVIQILKDQDGVDVNARDKDGLTPLLLVVREQDVNLNMMRFLVAACGADINAKDNNGRVALHHVAMGSADIEAFRFLVEEAGAEVDAKDNIGQTALHLISRYNSSNVESIRFLVEQGGDISLATDYGYTALDFVDNVVAKEFLEANATSPTLSQPEKRRRSFIRRMFNRSISGSIKAP